MTDLRQLTEQLARLREDVDYLTALAEPDVPRARLATAAASATPRLGSSPASDARPATPHQWHALTAAEAATAWTALTRWVDWLSDRYQLDEALPQCWYRHGALVEELDALRVAWSAAYLDPFARPADAAYWHDLLDRCLVRLRIWDRYGCTAGTHRDVVGTAVYPSDAGGREDYLRLDIATRARAYRLHVVAAGDAADS